MVAESLCGGLSTEIQLKTCQTICNRYPRNRVQANFSARTFGASREPLEDKKKKFHKELGLCSLRKRIEDSIVRAEMLTPIALELEEARHVSQEEAIDSAGLWDDIGKSNEVLIELADSAQVVDTLRDLKYKVEEVKLITELAEMDSINYELFKQAYTASLDLNKFLDKYEMSKLLKGQYEREGACITIESKCANVDSERWVSLLVEMYMKWAKWQGHAGRIVERSPLNTGYLMYATIEFEFKFAYGYLSGERGIHSMIRNSESKDTYFKTSLASVDVIPLFIESYPDLSINDEDILFSYPGHTTVAIQHIPTGLIIQSTGERSQFANKMKAINRMKSKLLTSSLESIRKCDRRYNFGQEKMVVDPRYGLPVLDVNDVLNGNLDPLIAAHLNSRTD